jgi:CO/xanthine dehydrogenase FAD-binding subunit
VFKSFRGAPRPYGNAVSYGNGAFLANVSRGWKDGTVIESVRLAFGAFGTKHAIRALKVEELLKGKTLSLSLMKESVELLKKEVVPLKETSKKDY